MRSGRCRPSMSFSTPRWSDRRPPSIPLGCPSVARRRSRRRLRNVGREPSMGVIEVDRQRPSIFHAGKPTPEQPVPQSPLRGRLTGTRGGWKARTNHSRPIGVMDVDGRRRPRLHDGSDRRGSSTLAPTPRWSDRRQPSIPLRCPSVARRRSRRRLRNVGRQPSMEMIDVGLRRPSPTHAGKPTPRTTRSAVSPSGATDGHPRWLEGSNKPLPVDGNDRRGWSTSSWTPRWE